MSDKTDGIRQEIKKGRQDIAATCSAITEKLAVLEERVQETVDGVKHTFDLRYQVKQRPWLMLGASVLAGFMLGTRGGSSNVTDDTRESFSHVQPQLGMIADVRNQFKNEIATIKGAAFGAVISTLWAMAKQVLLPPAQQNDVAITKSSSQPFDVPAKINGRSGV